MTAITQEELQTAVHAALVQWGKPFDNEAAPLAELLLVQNQLAAHESKRPFGINYAIDRVLLDCIGILAVQDETSADVLQRRFLDGKITRQVAQDMHASIDQVNRWQRIAIDALTQLLFHQENKFRSELTHQFRGQPAALALQPIFWLCRDTASRGGATGTDYCALDSRVDRYWRYRQNQPGRFGRARGAAQSGVQANLLAAGRVAAVQRRHHCPLNVLTRPCCLRSPPPCGLAGLRANLMPNWKIA